ncbi:phage late control D family protein [Cohnella cholangitidis]|uniref:Phage late control D family protein n=1 Tax=Cohnella cholangitidis TaxID=2598458 RepID=A0A7G5BVW8_9BACL|nr:contractile injection system protein, VgrG/Pvc8 family [Cohnella cholangitidis]QMV41102.1 phage late control D family protein [Cohnella cholangitidis]
MTTIKFDSTTYTYAQLEQKYRNFFVPAFDISVDGQSFTLQKIAVSSLTVNSTTDPKSDSFQFRIENAYDAVARQFKWLGSLIDVGKTIEIKMGYTDRLEMVFDGIITGFTVDYPSEGQPTIMVQGMDRSCLMMRSVTSNLWLNKKVSDVVKEIGGKYSLQLKVDDTLKPKPAIEQMRKSDFHFLRDLAEETNHDFFVVGQKLYFRKMSPSASPVITLMYGKNLKSYSASVDISKQVSKLIYRGTDPQTWETFEATASGINKIGTNGRTGQNIMAALSSNTIETVYSNASSQDEAQELANSMLNERAMELVSGEGECIGIPELRAGRHIKVDGLGAQFNQPYVMNNVTHTINSQGFITKFEVEGNAI